MSKGKLNRTIWAGLINYMVVKEKDWHMLIGPFMSSGTKYSTLICYWATGGSDPFTTDYVSDISPVAAWSTSKVEPSEPWKIWKCCKF